MANSINDFSPLEQHLLNDFQRDMPLSATPFADMARQLGVSEDDVMRSVKSLQEKGAISRVGPVFRPNRIGVSTLAAMSVAAKDLECVARIVSAFAEVNHNYEREHDYNLWFVVTARDAVQLEQVLETIAARTGLEPLNLPMLEDYYIDLGFRLQWT